LIRGHRFDLGEMARDAAVESANKRVAQLEAENRELRRSESTAKSTSRRKTIYDGDATDEEFDADLQRRRNRVDRVLEEFDRIWDESTGGAERPY
jgi:hypothetical protein